MRTVLNCRGEDERNFDEADNYDFRPPMMDFSKQKPQPQAGPLIAQAKAALQGRIPSCNCDYCRQEREAEAEDAGVPIALQVCDEVEAEKQMSKALGVQS